MSNNNGQYGKKKGPKKQPTGDYETGYARPPKNGKIKKGEVRNPYGHNGKPKAEADPYEKAMGQETNITINGEVINVTAEQAMYLKHVALAMAGNTTSFNILVGERRARRGNLPPLPTAQELSEAEAEMEKRKRLSAKIVGFLEEMAREKKAASGREKREAEEQNKRQDRGDEEKLG